MNPPRRANPSILIDQKITLARRAKFAALLALFFEILSALFFEILSKPLIIAQNSVIIVRKECVQTKGLFL